MKFPEKIYNFKLKKYRVLKISGLIETFQVKCGFGDYILDFYLNVF